MKIEVRAHPGSAQQKIIIRDHIYHVYVHSHPEKDKANRECIECLAGYFKVSKKKVTLVNGLKSKNKIFEIEN